MCAEALSQEEIDALLRGETPPEVSQVSPEEEDTINRYAAIAKESGSDVLSTLMGEDVSVRVKGFKETDPLSLTAEVRGDYVTAELNFKGMVNGKSVIIMSVENALRLAAQMTGGGADSEFGDLEESAFSEAIQNVFSSVNTQLAQQLGGEINLDPPDIITRPSDIGDLMPESSERLIQVEYDISSGAVSGPFYQIIPRNLLHSISSASSSGAVSVASEDELRRDFSSSAKTPEILSAPAQFAPTAPSDMGMGMGMMMPSVDTSNLELILDIKLEIKVELGRAKRKIKEVLELGSGSVVELDRLAGEPVDVLVNDKLFAKGEVVIIDENFGVRITDILSIQERIEALK
ncbi:MAG: flagellar motor switch protein FliN [Candidatus Omnitrophota bacterium]|jgi:flagellar motor switch protein FliN/FliY|nr:MAG: flagellar motor switch protein FliN [Candidatus Omnitrophota bacterium]